jgi:HK97 family phage portal protein
MGLITESIRAVMPLRREPVAAAVPTWQMNARPSQAWNPERLAREGYMLNEIVFACVEELASSAAEPKLVAVVQRGGKSEEVVDDHDSLEALRNPNPFMDEFTLWASVVMFRAIAGNAYVEIVPNRLGRPAEYWVLRPERMRAIPDPTRHIAGWEITVAEQKYRLPAEEVIHFRTRHPLDDFYGLPPLAVAARRTDLDNWIREFAAAFFRNAGVPAGLLNISTVVGEQEKELIRNRWRAEFGGSQGWHSLMIVDGAEATYQPMGMPLGERGLVMPDLTDINEARLAMIWGVPLTLIQSRLGLQDANRASAKEGRQSFWDETLVPLYRSLGSTLTRALRPYYPDVKRWEFDLSTVQALQEDVDAKHARIREDFKAGLLGQEEARAAMGYDRTIPDDVFFVPTNLVPTPAAEIGAPPPAPTPDQHAAAGAGGDYAGAPAGG